MSFFVQTVKIIVASLHYSHLTTPTFWGIPVSPVTELNGVATESILQYSYAGSPWF